MEKELLSHVEESLRKAVRSVGELAGNEDFIYPAIGAAAGYVIGKNIRDDGAFPLLAGLIGAGLGAVVAEGKEGK